MDYSGPREGGSSGDGSSWTTKVEPTEPADGFHAGLRGSLVSGLSNQDTVATFHQDASTMGRPGF